MKFQNWRNKKKTVKYDFLSLTYFIKIRRPSMFYTMRTITDDNEMILNDVDIKNDNHLNIESL